MNDEYGWENATEYICDVWDNEKDCVTLFVLVASCVSRKYFTKIFDVSVVVGGGGWSH